MKKRLFAAFMALVMTLSLLPASALAAEDAPETEAVYTETPEAERPETEATEDEIPETEPPEAEPAETPEPETQEEGSWVTEIHPGVGSIEDILPLPSTFGLRPGLTYSGSYYNQLDENSQKVYNAIYSSDLKNGPTTKEVSLSGVPYDGTNDSIVAALGALLYDHPELSWLVNTQTSSSYDRNTQTFISFVMTAEGYADATTPFDFSQTSPNYGHADTKDRVAITAAINAAKASIGSLDGKSSYEKVKTLYEWVCNNMEYADYRNNAEEKAKFENGWRGYQTAYSALVERVTVCAGYSKAFKLLCDEYNIPCAIITGKSHNENHAWNYVQMDDNQWYAIDCTWADQSTYISYNYLLKGSQSFTDHTEGTLYSTYSFVYPTLSTTDYVDTSAPSEITITYSPNHTATSNNDIPGFAVPTVSELGVTTENVITLTATVTGGSGQPVTWALANSDAGITLTPGENNTAKLTIKNFAAATKGPTSSNAYTGPIVTVTAMCSTTSVTKDLWVYVGYRTPHFVQILKDGSAVTSDSLTPGGSATYTAKVYDQYGIEMPSQGVSWSATNGATVTNGTVTVPSSAVTGTKFTVTATAASGSGSASVEITAGAAPAKPLTTDMVSLASGSFTYTGLAQTPGVTVTYSGTPLVQGSDYTVEYSGNVNVGTATVTVTGIGGYTGTVTKTFAIAPATPVVAWGTPTQTLPYTGSQAVVAAPTVTLVNGETFDGTITYSYAAGSSSTFTSGLPTNAGTYTIKASIAANGNYTKADSSNTLALTINKSQPAVAFQSGYNPSKAYDGTQIPNPTADNVTLTGASLGNLTFTWTQNGAAAAPINAGTYTLTASIAETANTAAASASTTVTISPAPITVTPNSGQHKEYGAADPVLTYTITLGQLYGNDKLTGALTYSGADVGVYPITQGTLAATANYTLTVASGVTFEITKPSLENATVTLSASSYVYDGTAKAPDVTVKRGTQTVSPDEYDVAYSNTNGGAGNHTSAGTVTVTVTAKSTGNYHGSGSAAFVISPKPVTAVVTAANKTYDGTSTATVTAAVASADLVSGDSINITGVTGVFADPNAGEGKRVNIDRSNASISGSGADNYTVTIPTTATASISKATVAIAWGSASQTLPYTGSQAAVTAPTVSAEGGVTVSVTPAYSYAADGSASYTPGLPVNAGTYTVRASIAESGNLTAASADMALTITPKTVSTPTIVLSASTFEYDGTEKKPAVTVKDGDSIIPASEYEVAYSGNVNVGSAAVTITNVAGNYTVSGAASFTITAKPLTGAAVTVSGEFVYTGAPHTPEPTVTLGGKTLVKDTDYTVAYADNQNAGTAVITITGKGNYSGAVSGSFPIAKASLTAEGSGTASGTYGAKLSELTITGLTAKLGGETVPGTWALTGSAVPNVGDANGYTAVFTPATGADNYNALTAQVTLSIAKANYSGLKTASTSARAGASGVYTLAALLPAWGVPGTITAGDIFDGTPSVSGGSLSYQLKADAAVGSTGTVTIPVTSANYNDFTLTITVTVADKDVPTLTVSAITVTYSGEAVPDSAIKGVAKVGSTTVPGTWAFVPGQGLTNVADSGVKTVKFTPDDASAYAEAEGTVTLTINKATPSGNPKYTAVSASGKTLADAALTAPDSWPAGTLAWDLPDSTGVTANTAYKWTFTPADAANYNALSGSITLWPRSTSTGSGSGGGSGSGSGSGSTSPSVTTTIQGGSGSAATTTAVPSATTQGGTATAAVSTATGGEIVTQAVKNNSQNVVIAPKITGNVTKTEVSIPAAVVGEIGRQTNASLTVSTPVANVQIPNGGLGSLSSLGGTVTVTAERTGRTVELSVTVAGRAVQSVPGGLTLTVPVSYATPGTVAVLVNADGTREVVRKSLAVYNAVTIPLDGSATLEIMDNSRYFADVPSTSWAADAVAFASAHELFNGTGSNQFSPNRPMSRGMLAVVLHNLEDNPAYPFTGAFADVGSGDWYAEGVAWAASKGIVTGYGSGQFGPGDNITREQLAVMLWRYAGSPAATNRELNFADAYRTSSWALDALRWATEKGIINGKGNGILDPGGYATRAETAQMLKNFMENQ